MRRPVLILLCVFLVVGMTHTGQAQTNDHLKCYKVKGDLKLKGFVDIETPQFGLEPGCKIGKPRLFCVPATRGNMAVVDGKTKQPITPLPLSGPPAPGDRICWQVKCPKPFPPDQIVTDQFGTQTLSKFKTKLLCSPAVKGTEFCGDGTVNGTEECEPTDDSACPGLCQADCSCGGVPLTCGNGTIDGNEECDPPADSACPGLCQVDCSCGVEPLICGNGTIDPNEECDPPADEACPGRCHVDCSCLTGHKCVFDDPNNDAALLLNTQIAPLPFPLSGSLDINCDLDGADPNTGKASCACTLQDTVPLNIPTLGFVCLVPAGGCAAGEVDCDGGNGLDTDLSSDHNVGACTGNADCAAQCVGHCGAATVFDSGCEGFCQQGARDGLACMQDDDDPNDPTAGCPDGSCAGEDGLPHGNICGCHCSSVAGAPSDPGDIYCTMGTSITVEAAAPCDGTDQVINIGTACIPITTANAKGIIVDANNSALKELPPGGSSDEGSPSDCNDLFASVTTGIVFVGKASFFDSALGDLAVTLTLACQ